MATSLNPPSRRLLFIQTGIMPATAAVWLRQRAISSGLTSFSECASLRPCIALSRSGLVVLYVPHAVARSVRALECRAHRVLVIHNGLAPIEAVHDQAAQLQSGHRGGQIGLWKGHEDLLDALALVARDKGGVSLHIFGSGDREFIASLQQKSSDLNLVKHVEWRGFVPELSDIFSSVDICVVPSRSNDPLPTSALVASN